MLSVAKFNAGSGSAIEKYMKGEIDANHREDYYSAEQKGQWHGKLADELGLKGEVKEGELARILDGYNPKTAEPLAANAGAQHAPGWDCTFSAPKSVSLEWAMNPDARADIEKAHHEAVKEALNHLSDHAVTNRDRHGEHAGQPVDGIVAATYQHGASREGDPQLHTHCAVANIVKRPDSTFGAADIDLRWKMASGAAYRAAFADKLQAMGYAVERDGTSFRLAKADKDHESEFSKRSEQIRAQAKETDKTSHLQLMGVAKDSRKDKELTPAELRESWEKAAKEIGYRPVPRDADASEKQPMPLPSEFVENCLAVEGESSITEMRLQAAVFVEAQGKLTVSEAREYLEEVKRSSKTVELIADKTNARGTARTEARYTTEHIWQLEKRIGTDARAMRDDRASVGGRAISADAANKALAAKPMSDDQKQAFNHITGEGRYAGISGVAGAGKTYMMDAARIAWEADGRQVIGCALAGKAAGGLAADAAINSSTIHKTLDSLEKGEITLDQKTVVVIDESGMVGSMQWSALQDHINDAGAKLVTLGECEQIQPVDRGGAMRHVQTSAPDAFIKMDEIRRQTIYEKDAQGSYILDGDGKKIVNNLATEAERAFVKDLRAGNSEKAIEHLEKHDRLKVYDTKEDAARGMAKEVIKDMKEGYTSIAMNPYKRDVRAINLAAREEARAAGMLKGEDKTFKADLGDRQFAVGDRAIFLKNDKQLGVFNGSTGTVKEAKDGKLVIELDGKTPRTVVVREEKYNKIDNGFAFTGHKSQGATCDKAHGKGSDRESHYVQGSRHRESYTMHVTKDERKTLAKDMEHSRAKGTSQDFTRKERDPRDPPGKPGDKEKLTPEKPEPSVRLAPKHVDVKRDGELARKALESHKAGRQAPDGKALDKAVKDGSLKEIRDSKGERYFQDAKGNIAADRLRESRLAVKELTDGNRVTRLVDNRIGRMTVMGKEITKGVKVGSKVIESKGLEAAGARKVRDALGTRDKDAGILKRGADRLLAKHEKWKEAGLLRNISARTEMGLKTKANERDAVKELEQKSAAGKQIEKKEAESTKAIKEAAKEREAREAAKKPAEKLAVDKTDDKKPAEKAIDDKAAEKPAPNPDLEKMRAVQNLDRQLDRELRTPPPPAPAPEIKIEPPKVMDIELKR